MSSQNNLKQIFGTKSSIIGLITALSNVEQFTMRACFQRGGQTGPRIASPPCLIRPWRVDRACPCPLALSLQTRCKIVSEQSCLRVDAYVCVNSTSFHVAQVAKPHSKLPQCGHRFSQCAIQGIWSVLTYSFQGAVLIRSIAKGMLASQNTVLQTVFLK